MAKDISETQIWYKIIKALNKAHLDYVLVGAMALVIHGLPRSTVDIDIYVPSKENILKKLFNIAGDLGLKSEQWCLLKISYSPKLFTGQWICFSYRGEDILDVFLADENDFRKLYKNSEVKKDKKISIRVASLQDIAAMKKSSARPIDIADLQLIREIRKYNAR